MGIRDSNEYGQTAASDNPLPNAALEQQHAAFQAHYLHALNAAVEEGSIIKARQSGEARHRGAQETLNRLLKKHPQWQNRRIDLYIHRNLPPSPHRPFDHWPIDFCASATLPELIEMGERLLDSASENSDVLTALLAHEAGHTINGDNTPQSQASYHATPKSHLREILANRMGAILFGNPKAYGEAFLTISECQESATHPSTAQMRNHFANWAKILESQGALNSNGDIIDTQKALDVFAAFKHTAALEATAATQSLGRLDRT